MERHYRYRGVLFFMVWFFLLGLYALIMLRNETDTPTFKAALLTVFIAFAGIVALAVKIRAEIKREMEQ
ncbi:MAG: hypothetical protein J7K48_04890 [Thermococcus sp.]|nr:hypothetical protein [Thermococcus sp.]